MRTQSRHTTDRLIERSRFVVGGWLLVPMVMLGVVSQTSLAPQLELRGVRPDWLLLISVYLGLRAPRSSAILGAWALGFFAELLTVERMGILSVAYALTAWWVGAVRGTLIRGSFLTGMAVTFAAGLPVFGAWFGYRVLAEGTNMAWGATLWRECLMRAVYTATWALPMQMLLGCTSAALVLLGAVGPARR